MKQPTSRPPRPIVFELREKADFLMKHPVPRGRIGADGPLTINALHSRSGIPLQSLQTAIGSENEKAGKLPGDSRLGSDHQLKLANLFGFAVGAQNPAAWPEWHDWEVDDVTHADSRRDTAQRFREAYLRKYARSRDTSQALTEGPDREPQRSAIRSLASVWLTSGQTGEGTSDVGVKVSCGLADTGVSHYRITVRVALLEIDCGEARARESSIRGFDAPEFNIKGSMGDVRCSWNGGDAKRLAWLLDGQGASLGTVIFEPGFLSTIEKLAAGDVITATLGTWLKHIDDETLSNSADTSELALVNRRGEEVGLPGDQLTMEQQRVIEHLRKRVPKLHDDNFAELAFHELEFVTRQK